MKVARLALACVAIGCIVSGYFATAPEHFVSSQALEPLVRDDGALQGLSYPLANRDRKFDRMATIDMLPSSDTLRPNDLLAQSHAALDPMVSPTDPITSPPLPRHRPKAQLLRMQTAYTLVSDVQIDAIKARLRLTPEQENSWPTVEVPLRSLAARLHEIKSSGGAPSDLPPDSPELIKLQTAATPFIAQLSANQKRELKVLAHLVGLGKVVAQL
jgi:hypothetical protein